MPWPDAVQETLEGVRLLLEVAPGASVDEFPASFNPWRGRIQVRVRAQAQEGKANDDVVGLVAAVLGCRRDQVAIVSGATDRRKTVAVRGVGLHKVLEALAGAWAER